MAGAGLRKDVLPALVDHLLAGGVRGHAVTVSVEAGAGKKHNEFACCRLSHFFSNLRIPLGSGSPVHTALGMSKTAVVVANSVSNRQDSAVDGEPKPREGVGMVWCPLTVGRVTSGVAVGKGGLLLLGLQQLEHIQPSPKIGLVAVGLHGTPAGNIDGRLVEPRFERCRDARRVRCTPGTGPPNSGLIVHADGLPELSGMSVCKCRAAVNF